MRIEPGALGRLLPPDTEHLDKYPHTRAALAPAPAVVETTLRIPDSLRKSYNQGPTSACVGFSQCVQASAYLGGREWFDGFNLYHAAQAIDGIQGPHEGSYVRAGFQVMRDRGPRELLPHKAVEAEDGVSAYFWCSNMDEVRQAHGAGRVVVYGINWYSNFDRPVQRKGPDGKMEWWIGLGDLGYVRGGHAIAALRWSDKRQAFQWTNSWGLGFPRVWVPASVGARLLGEDGEVGYGLARGGKA